MTIKLSQDDIDEILAMTDPKVLEMIEQAKKFKDRNNFECSLQKSSLAEEDLNKAQSNDK